MKLRTLWVDGFMAVTALAVGAEFFAGLDPWSSTVPWTELIARYVPETVTVTALNLLAAWLPVHFQHAYARWRGTAPADGRPPASTYRKLIIAALLAGGTSLTAALTDDHISPDEWRTIGYTVLGAIGVWAVPNRKTGPSTDDAGGRTPRPPKLGTSKRTAARIDPRAVPPRI